MVPSAQVQIPNEIRVKISKFLMTFLLLTQTLSHVIFECAFVKSASRVLENAFSTSLPIAVHLACVQVLVVKHSLA